jgi:hypothetical protein
MHSPATTPDTIKAAPEITHAAPEISHTNPDITPAIPSKSSTSAPTKPTSRGARWRPNKWLSYATENRERGMSTAEYAVGTIAACTFAAILFKVVSSPEVQEMLKALIDRALKING